MRCQGRHWPVCHSQSSRIGGFGTGVTVNGVPTAPDVENPHFFKFGALRRATDAPSITPMRLALNLNIAGPLEATTQITQIGQRRSAWNFVCALCIKKGFDPADRVRGGSWTLLPTSWGSRPLPFHKFIRLIDQSIHPSTNQTITRIIPV